MSPAITAMNSISTLSLASLIVLLAAAAEGQTFRQEGADRRARFSAQDVSQSAGRPQVAPVNQPPSAPRLAPPVNREAPQAQPVMPSQQIQQRPQLLPLAPASAPRQAIPRVSEPTLPMNSERRLSPRFGSADGRPSEMTGSPRQPSFPINRPGEIHTHLPPELSNRVRTGDLGAGNSRPTLNTRPQTPERPDLSSRPSNPPTTARWPNLGPSNGFRIEQSNRITNPGSQPSRSINSGNLRQQWDTGSLSNRDSQRPATGFGRLEGTRGPEALRPGTGGISAGQANPPDRPLISSQPTLRTENNRLPASNIGGLRNQSTARLNGSPNLLESSNRLGTGLSRERGGSLENRIGGEVSAGLSGSRPTLARGNQATFNRALESLSRLNGDGLLNPRESRALLGAAPDISRLPASLATSWTSADNARMGSSIRFTGENSPYKHLGSVRNFNRGVLYESNDLDARNVAIWSTNRLASAPVYFRPVVQPAFVTRTIDNYNWLVPSSTLAVSFVAGNFGLSWNYYDGRFCYDQAYVHTLLSPLGIVPVGGYDGLIIGGRYYAHGYGWLDGCLYYGSGRVWVPGFWAPQTTEVCEDTYEWIPAKYDWVWTGYDWEWLVVDGGYYIRRPLTSCSLVTRWVWIPGHWQRGWWG